MNQNKLFALIALLLIFVVLIGSSMYTVDQRERAIVVRLGKVLRYDDPPGLRFKAPLLDEVHFFDSRILTLDFEPELILTVEKKYVLVDYFVKWKIIDPLKYYVSAGGSETSARSRLRPIVESGLKDEFGKRTLGNAVSVDRAAIMESLRVKAEQGAHELGLEVVDVRIQRVDLPEKVSQAVYQRMEAERARVAAEYRAQGAETLQKIQSDADRQRQVLLADAYGKAERLRGEGDARATSIYAGAANQAPEFYSFYRSLGAYKQSFSDKSDVLVVDPSSDFFRYMKKAR
jgi:membrane protease subunit HflC